MWTWQQATHTMLDPNGDVLESSGYSGKGAAKNDPDQQCVANQGPIPRGSYTIGAAINHPKLGPLSVPLTPEPNNDMCQPQRFGFFIHGDGITDPGDASDGCIILSKTSRQTINASNDKTLGVVRGAQVAAAPDVPAAGALAEMAMVAPKPKVKGKKPKSPAAKSSKSQKKSTAPKKAKKNKKKGAAGQSKQKPKGQ